MSKEADHDFLTIAANEYARGIVSYDEDESELIAEDFIAGAKFERLRIINMLRSSVEHKELAAFLEGMTAI